MSTIGDIPIQPFGTTECVKCGKYGEPNRYGSTPACYVYGHRGQLMDVTYPGGPPVPEHIIMRCGWCGYEWITETADVVTG